ncbi:asparagine synthase-related protein [Paenibacillus doosanensis]|uniref:asparagine synthase-related protein n=1 Tax=Paenibacillus doosanensis TaxID=1229154 RepID=UPI00218054B8|nr:asparagine synthase-related protein [Paenibacillus doosanensis]MCS7459890.1 asparagine synthase-related protein [Paenibacillus doosanensis]
MPGFYISTHFYSNKVDNYYNNTCIKNEIKNSKYIIKRNTLNKFLDDKVFCENDKYIVIIEGVILNKSEIISNYSSGNFFNSIISMFENKGEDFFKDFKGSFSGAFHNKTTDEWIIFTNQIGDNQVFYYYEGGNFIVGSEVNYIVETLNKENVNYNVDEQAIYSLLTYSFVIDDRTVINEIKRIDAGSYIKISPYHFRKKIYFELTTNKYNLQDLAMDDLVDKLDEMYVDAVRLEYLKDREYNYQHLVELSGGLDSRMNLWVAHELGFNNILAITYSKSGYLDARIAEKIALKLQKNWFFKSLDDPNIIYDIDENIRMNFGLNGYFNVTKSNAAYKILNFNNIGICHTGQLGDVIVSSYLKTTIDARPHKFNFAESTKLIDRLDVSFLEQYDSEEMFAMNVRGFRGILNSHLIRKNYFETTSPFLDIDFLEFCMSIPLKYRLNHKLYKYWLKKKYPAACQFVWEKTGLRVNANDFEIFLRRLVSRGPDKLKRMMGIKVKAKANTMNPYDFWYHNNIEIKKFMDEYFEKEIDEYEITDMLRKDMRFLYNCGSAFEKSQVLTVLSALKLYFKR